MCGAGTNRLGSETSNQQRGYQIQVFRVKRVWKDCENATGTQGRQNFSKFENSNSLLLWPVYDGTFQYSELILSLQRHVSWILWSTITHTALVIIPEEAEVCIPMLRDGIEPPTHLLAYSAPVTRKMLHFSNLSYYAVPALPLEWKPPAWLTTELGIFAGLLYFDFAEYSHLQMYLGLKETGTKPLDGKDDTLISTEFHEQAIEDQETTVDQQKTTSAREVQSFTAKPLTFLQEWLAVRRKGQDFTHTPMGYVCQGKPLTESHPFFAAAERESGSKKQPRCWWCNE